MREIDREREKEREKRKEKRIEPRVGGPRAKDERGTAGDGGDRKE